MILVELFLQNFQVLREINFTNFEFDSSSEDSTPTKRSKTPPEIQHVYENHPQKHNTELQSTSLGIPEAVAPHPGQSGATRNDPLPQSSGSFINLSEVFPKDEFDLTG